MKNLKLKILAFLPVIFLGLTGCYTQVALEDDYSNWNRPTKEVYTPEPSETAHEDTTTFSEDSSYYEPESYVDAQGNIYNYNYYGYPDTRRYYWGYYPSFSFSVGFGWYYDPWYWDPWYYYPTYYYPTVCYYPVYWYPVYPSPYYYYGGGYAYGGEIYKYRSNDGYKIRNSNGTRNSGGGRNISGTRGGGSTDLIKANLVSREKQYVTNRDDIRREKVVSTERTGVTPKRTGVTSRDQIENINRTNVTTRSSGTTNTRNNNILKGVERTKTNSIDIDKELRKRNDQIKRDVIRNNQNKPPVKKSTPQTRTNTESGKRTDVKGNTKSSGKEYTPPPKTNRNNDTYKRPNDNGKSYSPPQRNNTTPPRSYNPPQRTNSSPRSTPPPRSSGGSSSGGGSRSGGNSGRTTR